MSQVQARKITAAQAVIAVFIVCIAAFVAWRVFVSFTGAEITLPAGSANNDVPPISNMNDLTTLENQLNTINIEDNTSADMDAETTF